MAVTLDCQLCYYLIPIERRMGCLLYLKTLFFLAGRNKDIIKTDKKLGLEISVNWIVGKNDEFPNFLGVLHKV